MKNNSLSAILRWIARIWGILSIAFILIMFIGEGLGEWGSASFKAYEIIAALFFPVGILVGIVIGYWKELLGGIVTICSLIAFYIIVSIGSGHLVSGPWFILVAAPGLWFIATALVSRKTSS